MSLTSQENILVAQAIRKTRERYMVIHVDSNLCIKTLVKADAPTVYEAVDANRTYLRQWLPWVDRTDSVAAIEGVIHKWENEREAGTDIAAGIFYRGSYAGNIGLHDMKKANSSGMIGYWLKADMQGCGIMSRCVKALTDYGFDQLGLNRIYIHCAADNKKSRAIPERLGFNQEGIFKDAEFLYGNYYDLVVYGIVKRDWSERMPVKLVFPKMGHELLWRDIVSEFRLAGEKPVPFGLWLGCTDYNEFLRKTEDFANGTIPQDLSHLVQSSTYFSTDQKESRIFGCINIRHRLNDYLLNVGGHIGYGVRPSEREKGYAGAMLKMAF